ncbi:DUF6368 family protein [Streptomyces sp. NPDC001970]
MAFCNRPVDHVVTALLTAAIIDVIGGMANAELREDQLPFVVGLPGLVTTTTDPWPAAHGSATFLRAWAQQPGFRLLKQLACSLRPQPALCLPARRNVRDSLPSRSSRPTAIRWATGGAGGAGGGHRLVAGSSLPPLHLRHTQSSRAGASVCCHSLPCSAAARAVAPRRPWPSAGDTLRQLGNVRGPSGGRGRPRSEPSAPCRTRRATTHPTGRRRRCRRAGATR